MDKIEEVSVTELAKMRAEKVDFVLLDVREPSEHELCHIDGKLIPLAQLPERLHELNPEQLTIIHCKGGGRSSRAVAFLLQQGFKQVKNLQGGIMAWRREIDPSLAEY